MNRPATDVPRNHILQIWGGNTIIESTTDHIIKFSLFFLVDHQGGSIIAKLIREVCYWKSLFTQAKLHAKPCKICQQFQK